MMPAQITAVEISLADRRDAGIRSGLLRDVHAVIVSRDGHILLEWYYTGVDEAWGRPLGNVMFTPYTLHDLRSVTKSIVGLQYGIGLDRKLVPPPDAPLLAQFPQYTDLAADPRRAPLTILNALNMTTERVEHDAWHAVGRGPSLHRPRQQRDCDGECAGPLPLHSRSSVRRRAWPALDLFRRRCRVAWLPDCQECRHNAAGVRARGIVRATRHHGVRVGEGTRWRCLRSLGVTSARTRSAACRRDGACGRHVGWQACGVARMARGVVRTRHRYRPRREIWKALVHWWRHDAGTDRRPQMGGRVRQRRPAAVRDAGHESGRRHVLRRPDQWIAPLRIWREIVLANLRDSDSPTRRAP